MCFGDLRCDVVGLHTEVTSHTVINPNVHLQQQEISSITVSPVSYSLTHPVTVCYLIDFVFSDRCDTSKKVILLVWFHDEP